MYNHSLNPSQQLFFFLNELQPWLTKEIETSDK